MCIWRARRPLGLPVHLSPLTLSYLSELLTSIIKLEQYCFENVDKAKFTDRKQVGYKSTCEDESFNSMRDCLTESSEEM